LLQSTKDESRRQSKGAGRGVVDDEGEKGLTRGALEGREILNGRTSAPPTHNPGRTSTKMKIPIHKAEIQKVKLALRVKITSVFSVGAVNIHLIYRILSGDQRQSRRKAQMPERRNTSIDQSHNSKKKILQQPQF
jgi:hypothetical protein